MLTALLPACIALIIWHYHRRVVRDPECAALHQRTCWSWAFVCGFVGTFVGFAAVGRASLGALVGAAAGYLLSD